MHSRTYFEYANDSHIAWDCILCNCPNYSTVCFSEVFSTTNQFSILSENSLRSPGPSDSLMPIHTSTLERKNKNPKGNKRKTLKILNINFQSIKFKQGELENLISSVEPDIIFGTETWIDSTIKDTQIFPGGFNIFRNDRKLSGGGVLIAVRDTLLTTAVPELQTLCESR